MDILRTVIKFPGHEPFEAIIPNSNDVVQSLVDGWYEHLHIDNGLHILVNEDAIRGGMQRNMAVFTKGKPVAIFGPIIFCSARRALDGWEFASLDTDGVIAAMQMVEDGKDAMVEMWEVV